MAMNDWVVANYTDPTNPNHGGTWVYKSNPNFANIHFSLSVDNPLNSHMGTDAPPASSYYYGMKVNGVVPPVVPHFAGAPATPAIQQNLIDAWNDYYTV